MLRCSCSSMQPLKKADHTSWYKARKSPFCSKDPAAPTMVGARESVPKPSSDPEERRRLRVLRPSHWASSQSHGNAGSTQTQSSTPTVSGRLSCCNKHHRVTSSQLQRSAGPRTKHRQTLHLLSTCILGARLFIVTSEDGLGRGRQGTSLEPLL